jgi:hypothetical protein
MFCKNKTTSPLVPGLTYVAKITVDSITTGCVRMVVNSAESAKVTSAGAHKMLLVAGAQQENCGILGEYTDAIIDIDSVYLGLFSK